MEGGSLTRTNFFHFWDGSGWGEGGRGASGVLRGVFGLGGLTCYTECHSSYLDFLFVSLLCSYLFYNCYPIAERKL